ncbi:hypothetical protein AAF712_013148 [Marasmius tenuissimus]|uniref:Uncharacterized protein n=1 Tax=Marasmius tenuissimus TaxID=585030 RepID=A0ABR2ZHZ7_9AGAR
MEADDTKKQIFVKNPKHVHHICWKKYTQEQLEEQLVRLIHGRIRLAKDMGTLQIEKAEIDYKLTETKERLKAAEEELYNLCKKITGTAGLLLDTVRIGLRGQERRGKRVKCLNLEPKTPRKGCVYDYEDWSPQRGPVEAESDAFKDDFDGFLNAAAMSQPSSPMPSGDWTYYAIYYCPVGT